MDEASTEAEHPQALSCRWPFQFIGFEFSADEAVRRNKFVPVIMELPSFTSAAQELPPGVKRQEFNDVPTRIRQFFLHPLNVAVKIVKPQRRIVRK